MEMAADQIARAITSRREPRARRLLLICVGPWPVAVKARPGRPPSPYEHGTRESLLFSGCSVEMCVSAWRIPILF